MNALLPIVVTVYEVPETSILAGIVRAPVGFAPT